MIDPAINIQWNTDNLERRLKLFKSDSLYKIASLFKHPQTDNSSDSPLQMIVHGIRDSASTPSSGVINQETFDIHANTLLNRNNF